jgi:hypothetical protein
VKPSKLTPQEHSYRAQFVCRAIEINAPLLATALNRYAKAENLRWSDLADAIGCTVDGLNAIAICRPPRPQHFVADVHEIAGDYVEPDRLLPLLRQLQLLHAFADPAAGFPELIEGEQAHGTMLLAARDRDGEANETQLQSSDALLISEQESAGDETAGTNDD